LFPSSLINCQFSGVLFAVIIVRTRTHMSTLYSHIRTKTTTTRLSYQSRNLNCRFTKLNVLDIYTIVSVSCTFHKLGPILPRHIYTHAYNINVSLVSSLLLISRIFLFHPKKCTPGQLAHPCMHFLNVEKFCCDSHFLILIDSTSLHI
jgi:hypothetical protein